MAWVPLHESGVPFEFWGADFDACTMDGSVVTNDTTRSDTPYALPWSIYFPEGDVRLRLTTTEYEKLGGGTPANAEKFEWGDQEQGNEASNPVSSFEPSPFEAEVAAEGEIKFVPDTGTEGDPGLIQKVLFEVWDGDDPPDPPDECNFNCECDDPNPSRTLSELRVEMMRRLGFSVMTANPPPGMNELLTGFLQTAQRMLYRQYPVLRTERFFTWNMEPGVRFYDLDANRDVCTKKLDPRMLSWVGISDECDVWRPLVCGIPPECYQDSNEQGVPYRYEIRQCIEVWPAPDSDIYKLRIKGDFGLEPFEGDDDQCTIDDEAVFLSAMARAKAHYGHPDARNYEADAINYIRNLTAGAHLTRRYVPGERVEQPLPKPIWLPKGS